MGGAVYRAKERDSQRDVALKSLRALDPRAVPRFENKFELARRIRHPNLVTLYDLDVTGEAWFFAMELVAGANVLHYVDAGEVRSSRQLRADLGRLGTVMRQIADGLGALHDADLRHDNLKPSNVLVTEHGRVVLTDYALAEHTAHFNTLDKELSNNPYMSPEQAGGGPLTSANDWYSLGVLLYEALTGRLPFATSKAALSSEPPWPSRLVDGIPPELDRLCIRLLSIDLARRAGRDDVLEVFDEPDTQTENSLGAGLDAQSFYSLVTGVATGVADFPVPSIHDEVTNPEPLPQQAPPRHPTPQAHVPTPPPPRHPTPRAPTPSSSSSRNRSNSSVPPLDFAGTDRFAVTRCLGRGGMGVVYEALDRERNMKVALKTLLRIDPGTIYRFKQEFRALSDVAHPNLISLYELVSAKGQWFFTMELLTGVDFVSFVRGRSDHDGRTPSSNARIANKSVDSDLPSIAEGSGALSNMESVEQATAVLSGAAARASRSSRQRLATAEPPTVAHPIDWQRLRDSLLQLAHGVHALHASGHMHRDIKPSNVIVTVDGRVVLLDFGVIAELGAHRNGGGNELVGTPMYMAPEQARGKVTKASDWYAVGVMLYRVLTGALPFTGAIEYVLFAKQEEDPIRPDAIRSDLPPDLVQLCVDLLQRDPEKRPTGEDVLTRLGASKVSRSLAVNVSARKRAGVSELSGRDQHLATLLEAFAGTSRGEGQTMLVHGVSGMGKSALVDHFLAEVIATPNTTVLTGRCYEREQVPYKGVDAAIDALSRYLLSVPEDEAAQLAPRDLLPLAKMFPVLESVKMFAQAERSAAAPEPQELRRRAFASLRALLTKVATRGPLVVFIDDAQWGDRDSAPLLAQLMRPPHVPPLLLLLSYRSDEADRSPLLSSLLGPDGLRQPGAITTDLDVGPLSDQDARKLAYRLLGENTTAVGAASTIARESRGHPYFIHELARHVKEEGLTEDKQLTLEGVIANRVARLPEPARRLMEIVAVAGQPISQTLVGQATVVDSQERLALVNQLRVAELIRTSGVGDLDTAECYHDRIREVLVSGLSQERLSDSHRRIAIAMLEGPEQPDPEALAIHFHGAGDVRRAFAFATKAADRAAAALAFDRAASLYRLALEFGGDEETKRSLNEKLGDALRNAGRGPDAAVAYKTAAKGATVERRLYNQRMAAEQLLYSGHLDEGLETIEDVLATVDLRLAKTPTRALVSLLRRRMRLRLRGLAFTEKAIGDIDPATIQLIDTTYGIGTSLSLVDTVRASDFQTLNLRLSLDAGDPYRICRSLAMEAAFTASMGHKHLPRVHELLALAKKLADRLTNPHAMAMVLLITGVSSYETGALKDARDYCRAAEELLKSQCSGVAWELACARLFGTWSSYRTGDFATLIDRVPALEREAEERGDLYGRLVMALGCPRIAMTLVSDRPHEHRKIAEDAIASWPGKWYQVQHFWADYALLNIDLYANEPEVGWDRIDKTIPQLEKSLLMRVEEVIIYTNEVHGRIALALARKAQKRGKYFDVVDKAMKELESRPGIVWCPAMASLLRAQVAALNADPERERAELDRALPLFEEAELLPYVMVTRLRLSALMGGRVGEEHYAIVEGWAKRNSVVSLAGLTRMLAPVFASG